MVVKSASDPKREGELWAGGKEGPGSEQISPLVSKGEQA